MEIKLSTKWLIGVVSVAVFFTTPYMIEASTNSKWESAFGGWMFGLFMGWVLTGFYFHYRENRRTLRKANLRLQKEAKREEVMRTATITQVFEERKRQEESAAGKFLHRRAIEKSTGLHGPNLWLGIGKHLYESGQIERPITEDDLSAEMKLELYLQAVELGQITGEDVMAPKEAEKYFGIKKSS